MLLRLHSHCDLYFPFDHFDRFNNSYDGVMQSYFGLLFYENKANAGWPPRLTGLGDPGRLMRSYS